ncbi:EAL domain-containing protein [Solimicrobium silvestre]|uniref:GGDEF: diguanylate cyclase (GGDEF) domain n=1 Tax=Solimicrobium silvestre TaxID=2099400 RepID=A0A2S9GUA9_9BURK|nr:EAL domain-containing protein [Solimicrobium silvestre]PRC91299.1 GGDEF: diguanylate cyclase (GGDEF) domain [Solimicrobium silvestre]
MQLPDHRFSTHRLTLFALYAGALLSFAALLPELISYATNTTPQDSNYTTFALGSITLLLFAMAYLYRSGHNFAINIAIIAMALSIPFVFDPHAFLYSSVPQGIWLPFIFALAVSQFRVALITLAISFTCAFVSYPSAFRSPRAIVESVIIFLLLMIGKLVVHRLMKAAIDAQNQINASKIEVNDNENTANFILDCILNGFEYGQLVYENGEPVDFIYIKVNETFETLTGLKNVIGKKLSEVMPGNTKNNDERLAVYGRVAATGMPVRVETYFPQLEKWMQLSVSSPKAEHFVAIYDVIAEPSMMGKKVTISTEQQQAFIQDAPVSIAMVDLDMNYIAYSQKWLKENGRGYKDLTGRNHYEINPDMPPEWKKLHQQAFAGVAINNVEFMWQQNDGTQRWLYCSAQPWKYESGEIGGLIIFREDITGRKIAESDLRSVLEESGDAIWISNSKGNFIYANPTAARLTGHSEIELSQLRLTDMIHEEREDELLEYLALTQNAKFTRREWLINHKNGSTVSVELTTGHLPGGRMIAFGRDLTEKMKTETERFKLFQAVEQSPGCIMITNLNADIEYVNAAFLKRTGYSRKEIIGKNPRLIKSGKTPPQTFVELWKTIKQGETWQGEIANVSKNGQEFIQFTTISPIRQSNGSICNYIAISEDITGRKKGEERIFELAYFDQLTGLPNRTLLLDRLNQVIAISYRSGVYGALLFIDLDHFKNINDTLGHQKGDLVLKQVAECLMQRIREGDTVARFGGDEFVVLLAGLGTDDDIAANKAKTAALKLLDALNQTYQLGDVVHHSTASIGVAMFNGQLSTTDELLKQADLAMYKSKKAGRNTIRFFDPSLESAMKQQATLEEDLRIALQDKQFILHYQGQFTSESKLTGAEVLVRWKHPEQGMMSPALFIPFAEESGLILPIGNWVLETACNQLAAWGKLPNMRKLVLAVNVSALQFRQPDFIETVLAIIERSGANPHRLKLELTESMLVENVDDIIQKMLTLKAHGLGFSLDDFGTGYSSLSFLKRLPLDQLKIDQSFIRDVHSDPNGAAIAKTIVSLGKSLGLNVIAEGVETSEQREFLANAGCFAYQGYLFSRPLAIQDFEELAMGALIEG